MPEIHFVVDSALLNELGERLVGSSHVALAELIKNSYDADATIVRVRFNGDHIEVIDNGNGMTFEEFKDYWMRIGTAHKQRERVSHRMERPLTGSKGVGRLAVQFLAQQLSMSTVSIDSGQSELTVSVDWNAAAAQGELTNARAHYDIGPRSCVFPENSAHGTAITLERLNQDWNRSSIVDLAKHIWMLQPPFGVDSAAHSEAARFQVIVESDDPEAVHLFEQQMQAVLDIWHARIVADLVTTKLPHNSTGNEIHLALQFSDGTKTRQTYTLSDCQLHALSFEIRVFHLRQRQAQGVPVQAAREYFNQFGGVHIYDAEFRLPYYGLAEADWLQLEMDHSHRLSRSRLLPDAMHVPEAMNYLPTISRLYGVVNVNTSAERHYWESRQGEHTDILSMSVTRDRLIDNESFRQLLRAVRWAIDYYAYEEAVRALRAAEEQRPTERASARLERIEDVLESHSHEIPKPVFTKPNAALKEAAHATDAEETLRERQLGLLGALATAGMSALAFEHEFTRDLSMFNSVVKRLRAYPRTLAVRKATMVN
jgi:hypothetical protein